MGGTILVVDNHDALREALRTWLEAVLPGHVIVEATSGEEAIAVVSDALPDVILMDITLSRMSGIEATRWIKANVPAAQVVILTIHEDEAHRSAAMAAGASAFIPKRLAHTRLVPVLMELLLGQCGSDGRGE